MKFKIERNVFFEKVNKMQFVSERRMTRPILYNILIEADATDNNIHFAATDLEMIITDEAEAEVEQSGRITVSAKKLFEILHELPDAPVSFELKENNWMKIVCAKSTFDMVGLAADDYPDLPEIEDVEPLTLSGEVFEEMSRLTAYATSRDENRITLCGVLFEMDKDYMRIAGTDGHRLSMAERKNGSETAEEIEVIIANRTLKEVRRMISSDGGDDIHFGIKGNLFLFKKNKEIIVSKKIEGHFPDYDSVIPAETSKSIKIDRKSFFNVLRRVSLFTDASRQINITIKPGLMEFTSETMEFGKAEDELPIEYEGEEMKVGFNVVYIMDILRVLEGENVLFALNDTSSPVVIQPLEKGEIDFKGVIMPVVV